MRRLFWLVMVLSFILTITACGDDDDNDDSGEDGDDDDDDTTAPAYDDPWNHPADNPHISLSAPVSGEFVDAETVIVQGIVTNGGDVEQVLVNGEEVSVNGGTFTKEVAFDGRTALPIYVSTITGGDGFGAAKAVVYRGQMASAEEPVADALVVGLGNDFLTLAGALIGDLLQDLDLMPYLESLNPIIDSDLLTVEVTAAAIGGATGQAVFRTDGLGFQGEITDLTLGLKVTMAGLPLNMEMNIGSLTVQGLADITVNNGAATVTITEVAINHADVTATGALPASVINALLGLLEGTVEKLVTGTLPGLLEGLLADLSLETTLLGFGLELALTRLDIDTGGMAAGFDLNAYYAQDVPTVPWQRGSLVTPGLPPNMLNHPAAATEFGIGAALSDDLLNRLLLALGDSALLGLPDNSYKQNPYIELDASTLSLIFYGLSNIDPTTPAFLSFHLDALPVAVPDEDGALYLRVPDLRMDCTLEPQGSAPWRAFSTSLDFTLALDIDFVEGQIAPSFPPVEFTMAYLDNPIATDQPILDFLMDWLPDLVGAILEVAFDEFPLEIPPIEGVVIEPLWSGVAGQNLDYWTAYLGLDYQPE